MSTTFASLPLLLLLPARLRLMQLMSASLLVLPLSASPILAMGCLEVGAIVLIVADLVAVVTTYYLAEVSPRWRHHVPRFLLTSQSESGRGCRRRSSTSSTEYLQGCNPSFKSAHDESCRTLVEGTARLCPHTGGPRAPPWV